MIVTTIGGSVYPNEKADTLLEGIMTLGGGGTDFSSRDWTGRAKRGLKPQMIRKTLAAVKKVMKAKQVICECSKRRYVL